MLPEHVDNLSREVADQPRPFGSLLSAVARQRAERDSRQHRVFADELKKLVASHAEMLAADPPAFAHAHVLAKTSTIAPDNMSLLAHEAVGKPFAAKSDQPLQVVPQPMLPGRETGSREMSVDLPASLSAALSRIGSVDAGLIEHLIPMVSAESAGQRRARGQSAVRPGDTAGFAAQEISVSRQSSDDRAQFLEQFLTLNPAPTTRERDVVFSEALTNALTSRQLDSIGGPSTSERPAVSGEARDRQDRADCRFIPAGEQRDQLAGLLSSDGALGSVAGDGKINALADQPPALNNPRATFDGDGGSDSRSELFAGATKTGLAQESMAAAASELERLRVAVRRTIDELDRVRGSVHAPLPALPVNRGSFRIS